MNELILAVGSSRFWLSVVSLACIYAYLGLTFVVLFRGGFIHLAIGAQLILAAVAGGYVGYWTGSPALSAFAVFGASAVVGGLPVWLRHEFGANEVLTTLFLTFAAIPLGQLLMKPGSDGLTVSTPPVPLEWALAELHLWGGISVLHVLAVPVTLAVWIYVRFTASGYRLRSVGSNLHAVRDRDVRAAWMQVTLIGAGCVALAVLADTFVYKQAYMQGSYDMVGFVGVIVGLLAVGKPGFVVPAAFCVALLERTFLELKIVFEIPQAGAKVMYGVLIVFVAIYMARRARKLKGV